MCDVITKTTEIGSKCCVYLIKEHADNPNQQAKAKTVAIGNNPKARKDGSDAEVQIHRSKERESKKQQEEYKWLGMQAS